MSSAPWRGKPRGTFRSGAQKLQREIALGCASDTLCKLAQDDDNEPTCVDKWIDDAKQPHLTGLREHEYRLISFKNLNTLSSKFHGCEEDN